MDIEIQEDDFKKISNNIMRCYQEQMHEYLNDKATGSLTDSDVILMIMNLTIGISTNIYYSLKQFLPTTSIDFDFIRAKLCNTLVDSFDKIKEFNPKDNTMALTVEQVKEIIDNGECVITLPDGTTRKVTKDDLLIKREEADKILNAAKENAEKEKEVKNADTPKIILPNNGILRG